MDVYAPQNEDLYVVFCGQPHAAHWLTKPLPQAMPAEPFAFSDLMIFVAFFTFLTLAVIGGVALYQGFDANPF